MTARTIPSPDLGSIMSWVGGHIFFIGHPSGSYDELAPQQRVDHLRRLTARMHQSVQDIASEGEVQRSGVDADKEVLRVAAVELFTQALHLAELLGMKPTEVTYRIPDAIDSARKLRE